MLPGGSRQLRSSLAAPAGLSPPACLPPTDKWVPLLEVPEASLLAWLAARRAEGYALLGLEQTSESQQLPAFEFPRKAVLVLGREREGLPAEVRASGLLLGRCTPL